MLEEQNEALAAEAEELEREGRNMEKNLTKLTAQLQKVETDNEFLRGAVVAAAIAHRPLYHVTLTCTIACLSFFCLFVCLLFDQT